MADRLPTPRAKQVVAALEQAGVSLDRQKGSHAALRHLRTKRVKIVPMHKGDIKRPLLKAIIKQAGLTEDEFRALL